MAYPTNPRYDDIGERRAYLVKEIAALYRLSPQTIYDEINAGRLKTFKIGRRRMILKGALDAWEATMQARQQEPLKTAS